MRLSAAVSVLAFLSPVQGFVVGSKGTGNNPRLLLQKARPTTSFAVTLPSTSSSTESSTPGTIRNDDDQTGLGGPVSVDMNKYNLNLEDAAEEWTANLVAESSMLAEGVYLGAKSPKVNFADAVKSAGIRRRVGEGLGIELLELAGGRDDGLGITIVSGIVEGGVSAGVGLLPGDSIVKIAVMRKTGSGEEEIASVDTECLGWDATVEAIGSLPPATSTTSEDEEEYLIMTVKRLRRKPKVTVTFQYPPDQGEEDTTIELFSGENLRRAMLVRGIKLNDPLSRRFDSGGQGDCGAEGTCATCAVTVAHGMDLLNEPGTTEQGMLKTNPRYRLACKAIVGYGMQEGSMTVKVNPRQWDLKSV